MLLCLCVQTRVMYPPPRGIFFRDGFSARLSPYCWWTLRPRLMVEVAAVAGSSLWRVITAQTRTSSRALEPVQTWLSFKWYAFTLNHSYCEWKCERPHCALSFMLNSLFPRDTWTANLSKVCFAEWKHPFPRWPNMSVSPLVMNIPWLHDRSLAGSAGDMWRLKPAATLAVRLRFPATCDNRGAAKRRAWHEDGVLVDVERERALALHLETDKQWMWSESKSIIVGRFCTSVLWCIFVLCHRNLGILKYPQLFLFFSFAFGVFFLCC